MSIDEVVRDMAAALRGSGSVTVLTGAGISAESGVATFRGGGGLWEHYRIEDVATPEAFRRDPALVLRFYDERRRQVSTVDPNPAHHALAKLQRALPDRFTLITQNVDDLHERAGSTQVLHMHGELLKARCADCETVVPWAGDLSLADRCRRCGGRLRPHIVWFGEVPFYLEDRIPQALDADLFLSIGTSGSVYPAAGMVLEASLRGKLTVEVNLEEAENSRHFRHHVRGKAGTIVPRLLDEVLSLLGAP
jgi:NAD-dependent deacetylase